MGRRTRIDRLECPNLREHTPAPEGYALWQNWAARMSRTHVQQRCSGCRRYTIWVPRQAPAVSVEGAGAGE